MLFIQKEFRNLSQGFDTVMQKWTDLPLLWRKEKGLPWSNVLSNTTKWRIITCKLTTSSPLTIVNTTRNFWNEYTLAFFNLRRNFNLRKSSSFPEEMEISELKKRNKFKNSKPLNHNKPKLQALMAEKMRKSQSRTNVLKVVLTESSIARIQK